MTGTAVDRAYANADFIPGGAEYPARWAAAATAFRARLGKRAATGIAYGPGARQIVDLFHPAGAPRGLLVFVHGGFWKAFGPADWSHLAAGALAHGWAVAMPGYTLAPAVRIATVKAEVRAAVTLAAGRIPGPLVIAGHSAGGHLAARMVCTDVGLPVGDRVARLLAISPLADLTPLLEAGMNDTLRLDRAEAVAESPVTHRPLSAVEVVTWVGGDERPAFLDQARALHAAWGGRLVVHPGRHHFDVIAGLEEPDAPLLQAAIGGL